MSSWKSYIYDCWDWDDIIKDYKKNKEVSIKFISNKYYLVTYNNSNNIYYKKLIPTNIIVKFLFY